MIPMTECLTTDGIFRKVSIRPRGWMRARFFLIIYRALIRVLGHVRQLVDSLPYKEEVRGSSPFVPTSGFGIFDLDLRERMV